MNSLSRAKSVCSFLGISRGTLSVLVKNGMPVIHIGKSIRYEIEDVLRWLKSQAAEKTQNKSNKEI